MSAFDDHQQTCFQCRVTPGNLCPQGKLMVLEEIENIPKSVQMEADGDAIAGKAMALQMLEALDTKDYEPARLIHACAFIFASLLSASDDGGPTLAELYGHDPIGDKEKIALFGLEVEALVNEFRNEKLKRMANG